MKLILSLPAAIRAAAFSTLALTLAPALAAQVDGPPAAKLSAEPSALSLRVGDSTRLKVRAFDAAGKDVAVELGVSADKALRLAAIHHPESSSNSSGGFVAL